MKHMRKYGTDVKTARLSRLITSALILAFALLSPACSKKPAPPSAPHTELAKATRVDTNGWINMHLEGTPREIGFQHGWLALYRHGGWGQLDARKRGGRKPKLRGPALAWIYRAITLGDPRQYKFEFALWTSKMVRVLIRRRWGISLSRASVCRLLNQLGLTAQRPLWRAYQQNPEAVERWLREEFPAIQREAKRLKAEIWFGDEAGVRSDAHAGTTWAPRGQTPNRIKSFFRAPTTAYAA